MGLSGLIEDLSKPTAYPEPVERVEVLQTHISVVFLAGPHVFKVKKPVSPGFLDFSTLERRLHFCREEVELNRRLAPDVYLGVVPIVRSGEGLRLEGEGEAVEWAVKMRRLSGTATLLEHLRRGEVDAELVQKLARRVASFHRTAERNERTAPFGRYDVVAGNVLDVFDRALPQAGTTVSRAVFDRVRTLAREALARLRPLIDRRAADGMTRDCHGDLHLDHVYYFPDRPPPGDLVAIDCIEFNESFRCIDPVADMAFAAMDLAFHGRRDLARAFADAYFTATGDESGRELLPLYTAYRATVRAMVEGLLVAESEVPEVRRAEARTRAHAHWLLALTELEVPERRPCLLLVTGLPGTGKSTLARGLAERAGFELIRSDVVRKELAGLTQAGSSLPRLQPSFYTPEWTDRTYAECLRRAEGLLLEGRRALVDATFWQDRRRREFLDAAVRCSVPAAILVAEASPEICRNRLEARAGDASDADWSVYLHVAGKWENASVEVQRSSHVVSTEGTPEQAIDTLRQLGLR